MDILHRQPMSDGLRKIRSCLIPIVAFSLSRFAYAALPAPEPINAQETAKDHPAFTIATGQITDAIGAGQKDVKVVAYLKNADGSAGREIAQTQSDAMGDFVLGAAENPGAVEIVVRFSKDQFAELTKIIQLEEGKAAPYIGEALDGNLKLTGTVLSAADKKPVSAAKVEFENTFTHRDVETDAAGRFEIGSLSPVQGELEVNSPGFGREVKTVRVPASSELVIELKPQRTVHFLVTDRAGGPLAGAVLECGDSARHDFRTLITGDDGRIVLKGLHFDASQLSVRLSRNGYVAALDIGESLSLPADKVESEHTLVMERAASITGHVRNAKDHSPLYGARVFAGDSYSDVAPKDWTDPEGKYSLSEIRPGACTVTVHLSGHAPEMKVVDAVPGKTANLDFEMGEAGLVRGIVKNESGEPVVGIEVVAADWRRKQTLGLRAMTDHQGRFTIENAPSDQFALSIFGAPTPVTRLVKAGDSTDAEFVFDTTKLKRNRLSPGEPAPKLTVTTLEGKTLSLSDLQGKNVLLIFWATWCAPCVAETPHLIATLEKFRGRNDFTMLGISRDYEEDALRDFLKANPKMTWPQAFGDAGGADTAAEAFGVAGIPAIFLIDAEGNVAATDLRDERIMQAVEKALGAQATP